MTPMAQLAANPMTARNGQLHRTKLLNLRARLTGDVSRMVDAALNKDLGSVVRMPTDMADVATDAFEQELTLNLLGNEEEVLGQIDAALRRIEEGTYGQCEECGRGIPKARLDAIPYTPLCVECAAREERGL
jgi:DnaK suppressor protein